MTQRLALTSLLVRNYDDAIDFYVRRLGFELSEDVDQGQGRRWVVVRPKGSDAGLVLAMATDAHQQHRIGDQSGGRVWLFLETNDFDGDYGRMKQAGIRFRETPRHEAYGMVAVFEDLYGNRWDLIEPVRR